MNQYLLPVSINTATPFLEPEICSWMWESGLVSSEPRLERMQDQKIIWFAGYLFPEMDAGKLDLITRFFCCLFILDDLLDEVGTDESMLLLEALANTTTTSALRTSGIVKALIDQLGLLMLSISRLGSEHWKAGFYASWSDYLEAQQWEVQNRIAGHAPALAEYKEMRLFSSGVYLALHLLKMGWTNLDCPVSWIEQKVGRIICLSNDLRSVEKERKDQDFHNELLLLQLQTGCSDSISYSYARKQLEGLFDQLFKLLELIKEKEGYSEAWVNELLLLLGGCMYWSDQDTARYGISVNGISKF
ncbi:Terpene synthase family, metal binding domain [Algoriphagus locisalis]|uniref:Terpene synthase n=1 Tax=Algoriphagus locisalis TaxID=305507 RepID=A0A1I7CR28_9BACT|nr:terpene synthase family protein [Algoriphagus locisalis]SFU01895.1 Terpene synthase family, metal binding domain [Algoriphagus locisalis]